jgi:hypothetical protein
MLTAMGHALDGLPVAFPAAPSSLSPSPGVSHLGGTIGTLAPQISRVTTLAPQAITLSLIPIDHAQSLVRDRKRDLYDQLRIGALADRSSNLTIGQIWLRKLSVGK